MSRRSPFEATVASAMSTADTALHILTLPVHLLNRYSHCGTCIHAHQADLYESIFAWKRIKWIWVKAHGGM